MKWKFFSLVAVTALLFACGTPSYTSNSSNAAFAAPDNLQSGFTSQYPTASNVVWSNYDATLAPVDWELNGWSALSSSDYSVRFDMDDQNYYAWYDANGNWIGSTYAIADYTTLPEGVNKTIRDKYSSYKIESVHRELWKDNMAYEIKLKDGDKKIKLLTDSDGNVIKEKMK